MDVVLMPVFRRLLAIVALATVCAARVAAQQPVSHQTLTVTNAVAVGLATATINPDTGQITTCQFTVEGGPVRVLADRTAPSAASGFWFSPGANVLMTAYVVAKQFLAIAVGPQAALQIMCMRGVDISTTNPPFIVSYDTGAVGTVLCNPLLRAAGACR